MLTNRSSVVVVGAGLAGLRTVERLRQRGYTGRIVLLGAESHMPYDRPPLSKQVLRGETDVSWLRKPDDYDALDLEVHLDSPVDSLDVENGVVSCAERKHMFDLLVIATGARPRRVTGLDGHVLRTLDDARELRASLHPGARLAIVGAGLIGCEVAASARTLGISVVLLDMLDAPMVRVAGVEVAARVAALHRERGVDLRLGVVATRPEPDRLSLSNGTDVSADVVLEAIGVVPNTEWLAASGLALDDGVVCDATGRAAERVYAVGDVARWEGERAEHWTNAGEQAARVAAAVIDGETSSQPTSYWWSDQYDFKIQGLGDTGNAANDVQFLTWGPNARTVALYSREGRLVGAAGFSAAGAVMRLRPDIADAAPVAEVAARLTS